MVALNPGQPSGTTILAFPVTENCSSPENSFFGTLLKTGSHSHSSCSRWYVRPRRQNNGIDDCDFSNEKQFVHGYHWSSFPVLRSASTCRCYKLNSIRLSWRARGAHQNMLFQSLEIRQQKHHQPPPPCPIGCRWMRTTPRLLVHAYLYLPFSDQRQSIVKLLGIHGVADIVVRCNA